jgi:hypothetical protein
MISSDDLKTNGDNMSSLSVAESVNITNGDQVTSLSVAESVNITNGDHVSSTLSAVEPELTNGTEQSSSNATAVLATTRLPRIPRKPVTPSAKVAPTTTKAAELTSKVAPN